MTEVCFPQSGEGWAELLTDPRANGGDALPPEAGGLLDTLFDRLTPGTALGIRQDGTPSVLFTFQPNGTGDVLVHWASDGRTPLGTSLDALGEWVTAYPGVRFLAFCRRPALVRLLAARGWWLQSHEEEPFMALMVCQVSSDPPPE